MDVLHRARRSLGEIVQGRPEAIDLAITCLLAHGHILIEDVPGVGKTTLALALARVFGLQFSRVQMTSDLLPSDLTGVSIFNPDSRQFEFRPGPLFQNVVMADELNRTPPKTQSALLEAMEERRVSVDGVTRELPSIFFVFATQNPAEQAGTFELPESQMDRFLMRIHIGYPSPEVERDLLLYGERRSKAAAVAPVCTPAELDQLQQQAVRVELHPDIAGYMTNLVLATRQRTEVRLGVSPRGLLALGAAARAYAMLQGKPAVEPEDVQAVAVPALAHRLVLRSVGADRPAEQRSVIESVLQNIPMPV